MVGHSELHESLHALPLLPSLSRLCAWLFRKGSISKCIQALPVNSCLSADKADCNAAANIVLWQLLWAFLKYVSPVFFSEMPYKYILNHHSLWWRQLISRVGTILLAESETHWDVHPSWMSNVADMMGCWRVINILQEKQEEVNITSITNPHLELCFCNNIFAIRPNPHILFILKRS